MIVRPGEELVLGVQGPAQETVPPAAPVISGGAISVIVFWLLFSQKAVVTFSRAMSWRPDWAVIRALFRFGLPTGIQGVAMNVGGVFLLRFIGSLQQSAEAQAAYAVSYVELFSLITWTSVGLMGATAAVSGQNLGAGRPDRTAKAVQVANAIGLVAAFVVGGVFLAIPGTLLGVFGMEDPAVVELGVQLLSYLAVSGFFITTALTYTGGLQGTGDTKSPLYISLVSQIVIPLGMCFVIDVMRELQPGDIWLAIVLGHFTRATLSIIRFRQGKWRDIRVDIGPAQS